MSRILLAKDASHLPPSKYWLYGGPSVSRDSTFDEQPGNLPLEGFVHLTGYVAGICTDYAAALDSRNGHVDNAVWISSSVLDSRGCSFPDRRYRRLDVIRRRLK